MRRQAAVTGTVENHALSGAAAAAAAAVSQDTRLAILHAARQRFLHYGYKKTTIDEIAAAAGVGKGTVYLYFAGKEEILLTIVNEVKRNVTLQMRAIAASLAAPEEKLRQMILARILSVYDATNASAHGVEIVGEMLRPQLMACGREEHQAQLALMADVLREGFRQGKFTVPENDFHRAAEHLSIAFVSFFPPYASPCHSDLGCRASFESRASSLFEFLMQGLRRRD